MGLKHLVSLMTSVSAGCRYCQAHTAISAQRFGVSDDKVAAVFDFETSDLISGAERAALRLARDAGVTPNAVTPTHFDDMYRFYSAEQIVEIVSSISFFGFLNRWNETMSSELEPAPLAYAEATLRARGWEPGKHAPQTVIS
jgi:AhpD family alkylhydroperoxidase